MRGERGGGGGRLPAAAAPALDAGAPAAPALLARLGARAAQREMLYAHYCCAALHRSPAAAAEAAGLPSLAQVAAAGGASSAGASSAGAPSAGAGGALSCAAAHAVAGAQPEAIVLVT